jgi:hypothetical protein
MLAAARRDRQRATDEPLVPIAPEMRETDACAMTEAVKRAACESGADNVGVAPMRRACVRRPQRPELSLDDRHRGRAGL